jgi:hypothetical protein
LTHVHIAHTCAVTNRNDKDLSGESSDNPVERLWAAVVHEWEALGKPDFSRIENWSTDTKQEHRLSRGTLSDWFANHRMPREGWNKFKVLLLYFNVDTKQWHRDLWLPAERYNQERRRRNGKRRSRMGEPAAVVPPLAAPTRDDESPRTERTGDRARRTPLPLLSVGNRRAVHLVPLLLAVALALTIRSDMPPTNEDTPHGLARSCANVRVVSAPVFANPAETTRPVKHKYRGNKVELVVDLAPVTHTGITYRAVRTPRERDGVGWMREGDLSTPRTCGSS